MIAAVVWAHEVMHIKDIGKPTDTYSAIIDVPVKDYPGIDPFDPRHPDAATGVSTFCPLPFNTLGVRTPLGVPDSGSLSPARIIDLLL